MINWSRFHNHEPLHFILGPCQIESEQHACKMALFIQQEARRAGIPDENLIFKASYDKANRTSVDSPRGVGIDEGLRILRYIRNSGFNVTTDVHDVLEVERTALAVDLVQIPALLSRQTDLLDAAGEWTMHSFHNSGVSIKKGQFASPWSMHYAMEKVGHDRVVLIERGTTFGYGDLVVDMRGIDRMKTLGRVVMDASHAAQRPGGAGSVTNGLRRHVPVLAKAATALGIAGVFMEVHDNPDKALSDGSTSIHIDDLREVLESIIAIDRAVKGY